MPYNTRNHDVFMSTLDSIILSVAAEPDHIIASMNGVQLRCNSSFQYAAQPHIIVATWAVCTSAVLRLAFKRSADLSVEFSLVFCWLREHRSCAVPMIACGAPS